MEDLDKKEYVYLMIVRIQNKDDELLDSSVHPFKTEIDVNNAMLNVISKNARNYKSIINYIAYSNKAIVNTSIVASARIDFNSRISKTYEAVRRRIEEVK